MVIIIIINIISLLGGYTDQQQLLLKIDVIYIFFFTCFCNSVNKNKSMKWSVSESTQKHTIKITSYVLEKPKYFAK